MKKRIATILGIALAVSATGALAMAAANSIGATPAPVSVSRVTQDSQQSHERGDDKGTLRAGEDNPATHDVNDDKGVDNPATHDVNDDKGADATATPSPTDDNGVDNPPTHDVNDDSSASISGSTSGRSTGGSAGTDDTSGHHSGLDG